MKTKTKRVKDENELVEIKTPTPPHATELETAILGAIMLEGEAMSAVSALLKPKHFYSDFHKLVFQEMTTLFNKPRKIDILTVTEQMMQHSGLPATYGVNIPYEITRMTNAVVSSANIVDHSRIILQKFMLRRMSELSAVVITRCYEFGQDAFELAEFFSKAAEEINDIDLDVETEYSALALKVFIEVVENDGTQPLGPRSGYKNLDKLLMSFFPHLYVIAARPSMGKTSFMIQLIENISKGIPGYMPPKKVGFLEIETADKSFIIRHFANKLGLDSFTIRRGGLTEEQKMALHEALQEIDEQGIVADFIGEIDVRRIKAKAKRWIKKYGIEILLIDYLQLVEAAEEDRNIVREQQVSKIVKGLARASKELGIPFIAFAQVGRGTYAKANKEPELNDLRESGAIEAAARFVAFLHRPEYYGITEDEFGNALPKGLTKVLVKKHNDGPVGESDLIFRAAESRFIEDDSSQWSGLGGWQPVG